MKKLVTLIIAGMMALSMVACSSITTEESTTVSESQDTSTDEGNTEAASE